MHALIIDQFPQQTLLRRIIAYTLTCLGWSFWIYLWLPLLDAITTLLGFNPMQAKSAALSSILTLINTLNLHVLLIAYILGAFLLWAILQWLGKYSRLEAIRKHRMMPSYDALPHLKQWQEAQHLIVNHDDNNGSIVRVQITDNKKEQISGLDRAYPNSFDTKVSGKALAS
jgi:poly-beta-1,6-N-acetyl-D-glucosamine biosynthesis protein PgaD